MNFHENVAAGAALPRNVQFPDISVEEICFAPWAEQAHGAPHFYLNIARVIRISLWRRLHFLFFLCAVY